MRLHLDPKDAMNIMHPKVVAAMADRSMRMAHLLWHLTREFWERLDKTDQQAFQNQYPEWVPPDRPKDAIGMVTLDENSGRDFLYMHREMIKMVNGILASVNEPPIAGWSDPPDAADPTYRVVTDHRLPPGAYRSKDDQVWTAMVAEAKALLQPINLTTLSIGKLGAHLEYGIHAAMHERFGEFGSFGKLRDGQDSFQTQVPTQWDDPLYETLLDAYSAHVHPWFWKIHGWIDDQIRAWETANGKSVEWGEPWLGPMAHHDHLMADNKRLANLQGAIATLRPLGASGFFRPQLPFGR